MKRAIGILGGTFDPVHIAHLRLAIEVQEHAALEQILFLPCKQPVHKETATASPPQRLAMLQLACADYPHFIIDEREITRLTPSFMIDSLTTLRRDYPTTPLCLLIGVDAFNQLHTWHRWQELSSYCHFIIVPRPSYNLVSEGAVAEFYKSTAISAVNLLHSALQGFCYYYPGLALDIAATAIRERLKQQMNVDFLIPKAVQEYIAKQNIYTA